MFVPNEQRAPEKSSRFIVASSDLYGNRQCIQAVGIQGIPSAELFSDGESRPENLLGIGVAAAITRGSPIGHELIPLDFDSDAVVFVRRCRRSEYCEQHKSPFQMNT